MSASQCCAERLPYIGRSNDLDALLSEALHDVKEIMGEDIDFVIQQTGLFEYSDYGLPTTLFAGSARVKSFDKLLFDGLFGQGLRGNYHPESGRIFLRAETWCKHCLIHETLHAVSILAAQQNIAVGNRYLFLREGLTEFLTGYILFRKYPNCYQAWKNKTYENWCALPPSYEEMARIWFTFCRFVSLNYVKRLFLGNDMQTWNDLWNRFLGDIRRSGYPDFRDPMPGGIGRFQDRFLDECKKRFGKANVERIFESESLNFGYGNLRIG